MILLEQRLILQNHDFNATRCPVFSNYKIKMCTLKSKKEGSDLKSVFIDEK